MIQKTVQIAFFFTLIGFFPLHAAHKEMEFKSDYDPKEYAYPGSGRFSSPEIDQKEGQIEKLQKKLENKQLPLSERLTYERKISDLRVHIAFLSGQLKEKNSTFESESTLSDKISTATSIITAACAVLALVWGASNNKPSSRRSLRSIKKNHNQSKK